MNEVDTADLEKLVAILVDKWVARSVKACLVGFVPRCNPRRQVGCQSYNKSVWQFTIYGCNPRRKKVNKFNREMLQIVHFPFLCCQPNSS